MKYTAEEVRAIAKRLHDDITVADGDALMASDMLTAYAARIEADEEVVPFGYLGAREMQTMQLLGHAQLLRRPLPDLHIMTPVYLRPPAQATQVGPAAKPHTLADFVHASGAERAQIGQQVAARMDEMMAEPVAQGEVVYCPECGSRCTYRAISMSDDVIYEYTPAQPAQSVDVDKVRRVAADIRHWNEAICHPALNVFADKLEAALPELKP